MDYPPIFISISCLTLRSTGSNGSTLYFFVDSAEGMFEGNGALYDVHEWHAHFQIDIHGVTN